MSKITVTRLSEWNNRMREVGVYVDGKKIGAIGNGETKSFEIPEGTHQLKAKIDWCGSQEAPFVINGNETKYFSIRGFQYSNLIMPVTLAILVLHIIIRRTTGINYIIWFALPSFLLLMYYLTLGRNDYLRVKETDSWETS